MEIKELNSAIEQIAEEKELPREKIIETIEKAVASAYKKEYGRKGQKIFAKFNEKTGKADVFLEKLVVSEKKIKESDQSLPKEETFEEIDSRKKPALKPAEPQKKDEEGEEKEIKFKPSRHILLKEAKKLFPKAKEGDAIIFPLKHKERYGRIAAQTAKQVIIQKIREAEREILYKQYKEKEGKIISGVVQRIEREFIYLDLGKVSGVLPPQEQIPGEIYNVKERIRVYVVKVEEDLKGPLIFLSRSHPQMLAELFKLEVPEIASGLVEIVSITREPGSRSKIAVRSNDENIDPIGACVGQRGTRIATVINEFNGEKIDIVKWNEDIDQYITNALSPAKILDIKLDKKKKQALALVAEDQQSLAIGKKGQNVRLAAKLTGWKIDIQLLEQKEKNKTKNENKKRQKRKG